MARRPHSFTEEDFESLEGRASKTEQKKEMLQAFNEYKAKQN